MLLAGTIANPLRRLAAAAVRVRRSIKLREEIPDFSNRQDEIGNLSVALRDMTNSLYAQIDAIESFAADVSHELKNPLTSLRSAVETLPLARNEGIRKRLTDVIQHDVRRLDRLISDISDASRLDAELVREDATRVDVQKLLRELTSILSQSSMNRQTALRLHVAKLPPNGSGYLVSGHDLRIGQVVTNLVQNAFSFVPADKGRVDIRLSQTPRHVVVEVEDNGPGIQAENIDNIFKRFYTDRPGVDQFGRNSGLGLSISRQIVEAHGGTLTAENIQDPETGKIGGARFTVKLPRE
jgi:two-component system sensor histidine kinase ChvG